LFEDKIIIAFKKIINSIIIYQLENILLNNPSTVFFTISENKAV
jgi:hypothetical protein